MPLPVYTIPTCLPVDPRVARNKPASLDDSTISTAPVPSCDRSSRGDSDKEPRSSAPAKDLGSLVCLLPTYSHRFVTPRWVNDSILSLSLSLLRHCIPHGERYTYHPGP